LIDYPHLLLPLRHVEEKLQTKQVKKKNLNSKHDLPHISEGERDALFATCKFYGSAPVYKQAVFGVAINAPPVGGFVQPVPQQQQQQQQARQSVGGGGILGRIDNTVTRAVYSTGLVPSHIQDPNTFVKQQMQNVGFNMKSQYNTNTYQGIQGHGPSTVSMMNTSMTQNISAPQREQQVKSSSPTQRIPNNSQLPSGYSLPQIPPRQQQQPPSQIPYSLPNPTYGNVNTTAPQQTYTVPSTSLPPNPAFSFGPTYTVPSMNNQNPGLGLPPDWAHYTDSNGRVYYHNRKTNVTQWTKPTY